MGSKVVQVSLLCLKSELDSVFSGSMSGFYAAAFDVLLIKHTLMFLNVPEIKDF